jgi:glutamate dehydrogenase (NADP+)
MGVGAREVGYMSGMMKKLTNSAECVFTGKGLSFGGSLIRPEATGYGLLYFVEAMLRVKGATLEGKTVTVSGSGNVAQYAIEKAMEMGAKVITASDSSGVVFDPDGFTPEKLAKLMEIKNQRRGLVADYAHEMALEYITGATPWQFATEIALPCATQNELNAEHAQMLIDNGVQLVAEGANMPSTAEAIALLHDAKILFAPGKAANAGGVAASGLEMSQNALRLSWTREKVDMRLCDIMYSIHDTCQQYGREGEHINYELGANVAGFVKVADAMKAQGVY